MYQKYFYPNMSVIYLILFVMGCATTQPAPDRVATGVAEQKAIAATLTADASKSIKPAAGKWEGWIDSSMSGGSEMHYWVQFEVNQDGTLVKDKVKDVWVAYIEGPKNGGDLYQNSRAENSEIVGNNFNSTVPIRKQIGSFPQLKFYEINLELEGIFTSTTKLEATFKSEEDDGGRAKGFWTAELKQP